MTPMPNYSERTAHAPNTPALVQAVGWMVAGAHEASARANEGPHPARHRHAATVNANAAGELRRAILIQLRTGTKRPDFLVWLHRAARFHLLLARAHRERAQARPLMAASLPVFAAAAD
ncbi:MAG: hypothetical protein HS116_19010 [Planctomycetes bacterium]|nr:hypothetical protein [Planctomycetota bacterium]